MAASEWPRFELYEGEGSTELAEDWRWRLRAANGRIIANGGEGFTREGDARRAVVTAIHAIASMPAELPMIVTLDADGTVRA